MKKKSNNYLLLILGIEGLLSKDRCSFSEEEKALLRECIGKFEAASDNETVDSKVDIELLTASIELFIQLSIAAHVFNHLF